MKFLPILFVLALAACSSDGDDTPYSGWSTQFSPSMPERITNSFNFPKCSDPISPDGPSVHYVTKPTGPMAGGSMVLTYRIEGNGVFAATEGHSPRLALYFQRKGDDLTGKGKMAVYRWYSKERLALKVGTFTLSAPLSHASWGPVFSSSEYNTIYYFQGAMENAQKVGFVLGGSVGAGHGVCLKSGSAKLTIESFSH
jgi:hypothetical protein